MFDHRSGAHARVLEDLAARWTGRIRSSHRSRRVRFGAAAVLSPLPRFNAAGIRGGIPSVPRAALQRLLMGRCRLVMIVAVLAAAGPAMAASAARAAGSVSVSVHGKGTVTGSGIDCSETGGPVCARLYADTQKCFPGPLGKPICVPLPPSVQFTAGNRGGFAFQNWQTSPSTGCDGRTEPTCAAVVTQSFGLVAVYRDVQDPTVGLEPGDGAKIHGTAVRLLASADDNDRVAKVIFRIGEETLTEDVQAPFETTLDTARLRDGTYEVSAEALDATGLKARVRRTYTVDNTAPKVAFTNPHEGAVVVSDNRAVTVAFTTDDNPATLRCALDGKPRFDCRPPVTLTNIADGNHEFAVEAADALGNTAHSVLHWEQETPATVAITDAPASGRAVSSTAAHIRFTSTNTGRSVTFQCRLDSQLDSGWRGCSSPHNVTGLSQGPHTFEVRAISENILNQQLRPGPVAARGWIADTLPPDTRITGGPSEGGLTSDSVASFLLDSEPGAKFQCATDGQAFHPCTAASTISVSAIGVHTFQARAVDGAGNVDPTADRRTWKVTNDADGDGALVGSGRTADCDDRNADVHPGAHDTPGNHIDEDCDNHDADFPRIGADIIHTERGRGKYTVMRRLAVINPPAGARITLTCRGRGCRMRRVSKTVRPGTHRVSLLRPFRGVKLLPKAVVEVTVTTPAAYGKALRLTTRRRNAPRPHWFRVDPETGTRSPW